MTQNKRRLKYVINRSMALHTAGKSVLSAVEQAMDECNWPESDEETTIDDLVEKVETYQNTKSRVTHITSEEREQKDLARAQKDLDRKAANMTPLTSYYLKHCEASFSNGPSDDDDCSLNKQQAVSEWERVLNVIDTLHERFDKENETVSRLGTLW